MTTTEPQTGELPAWLQIDLTAIGITVDMRDQIMLLADIVVNLLNETDDYVNRCLTWIGRIDHLVNEATKDVPQELQDGVSTALQAMSGVERLWSACQLHAHLWEKGEERSGIESGYTQELRQRFLPGTTGYAIDSKGAVVPSPVVHS